MKMETQQLSEFLDSVIEGAYQSRCFKKEDVQSVLLTGQMIKQKMVKADELELENTARSITIENLQAENELLKKKFNVSFSDLETLKKENVINEIDVKDIEEVSNHVPQSRPKTYSKT